MIGTSVTTTIPEALTLTVGASAMQGVTMQDRRTGRAWMVLVAECKRTYPWVCHLCGQPIPRAVHKDHRLAYQADHVMVYDDHPLLRMSLHNLRPSHRQCNRHRGKRPLTPALLAEIRAKFAPATDRPALSFFDI